MTKKIIIPIVLIGAVASVAVATRSKWLGNGKENGIRISGNIEMTEVKVAFKISGKLTERAVNEGDRVQKDMVIARLDQEQLLHQRAQAQAVLESAQSQLTQLMTGIEYQRAAVESQIGQQRAQLQGAEAQLSELEAGSRPMEIEQSRARVSEAKTELERATADWERAQPLFKADDISRSQYDQFQARYQAARAQLRQAQEVLQMVEEGPRKERKQGGQAQVAQAQAGLRLAEAQRLELKRREQEVATRRAEIDRAKAQMALIESQIKDTIALAPVGGVVLSKSAEVGEVLAAGTTVLTIGDLEHPWLRGYINEQHLGRVKIGDKVKFTTDSFPGKVYDGRISFIASDAEFTPKQIQTEEERVKLVYRIKVDVGNPNQELKLNMPADAELVNQ